MIQFEMACEADAVVLKDIQMRAFLSQVPPDMPDLGGPEGYDTVEWQIESMKSAFYIKILSNDEIVGGMVLDEEEPDHCHLNRIFIDPPYHGQGIGTQALQWLEKRFSRYSRWTLRTAAFHIRNQRLYERLGYKRTGEVEIMPGFSLVEYEKRIGVELTAA